MSLADLHSRYSQVDEALQEYLERFVAADSAWLLLQTLLTGERRRKQFERLPADAGLRWLDAGAGFGALAFDAACAAPREVVVVDVDLQMLEAGEFIRDRLRERGALQGDVTFVEADITDLPFPVDTFAVVSARFLFQHLRRPADAAQEIMRVLKPGGYAYVVDVDDRFAVSYPPSAAYERLAAAFCELQTARGGDRFVGRKLAHLLGSAGLSVREAVVDAAADAAADLPDDLARRFALLRLDQARADMHASGILDGAEFERLRADFAADRAALRFQSSAEVIVVGQKPPTL